MELNTNIHGQAGSLLAAFLLAFLASVPGPASARSVTEMTDCEKSPFSGSWISSKPSVAFLSKLEIIDSCKQIVMKPVADNNPWAGLLGEETKYIYRGFTLRPSSTCSPIDCVWGRAKGKMAENGVLKAHFSMFWSQRILQLTLKKQVLRVKWRIKYSGRKKPDQLGETLLIRAQ